MEDDNMDKELLTRREFFKKAAKSALPFLVAIALTDIPFVAKAVESAADCRSGCIGKCSNGCTAKCKVGCMIVCSEYCKNKCKEYCKDNCVDYCKGKCKGCKDKCDGTCKTRCQLVGKK